MTLLFLGPPGSGKDTQASLLAKSQGYAVVSTGQVIRDEAEKQNPSALEAIAYSKRGEWSPDDLTYKLLAENLQSLGNDNIILTGAVRRDTQVKLLDDTLARLGKKLDKVFYFDLPDEDVFKRLSHRWFCEQDGKLYNLYYPDRSPKNAGKCDLCGGELVQREDDKPEIVRHRLAEVREHDAKIIADYEARGILVRIDARPSVEEIGMEVKNQLAS